MDSPESKIDKLVLVVHGVGDPQPGETLGLFARSIAEDHHPLGSRQHTLWLAEKSSDPNFTKTFPAHVRNLKNESERIEMTEVYWGDLSRVWRGLPGAILGLFQILFGLRYVAYVAADQPGACAYWLKRLGLICSRILHGPVLSVSCFLAILAFAIAGTQLMWADSYKSPFWTQIVLGGCCVFALAASSVGWRITRSRILERFWFWVNVVVIFVAAVMFAKPIWIDPTMQAISANGAEESGLIWYCHMLVILLGTLWFTEILVVIAMAGCWLGALLHPRVHRPALHIAFLLPALSVGVWGLCLPMFWLALKWSVKNLLKLPEFDQLFNEAIPILGAQFLMLVLMAIAAGLIGIRFIRWRLKHEIGDFESGARPPRLIVHGFVQLVMAVCTLCGVSMVLMVGMNAYLGLEYEQYRLGKMMAETNKYAMGILAPASLMTVFLIPRLTPVFDIVLDVVNHFYFRATNLQDGLDDEDEFNINETTFEQGTLFFSRRDAIHGRMKRILSFYRDTLGQGTELIIVSHSQGTMVAIDVLNDPEMDWLKNRFSNISLVTMGSPLQNLYQHYFVHLYPSLDQPYWSGMRKQLGRWINIFRIDDPVGNEIQFPGMNVGGEHLPSAGVSANGIDPSDSRRGPTGTIYSNHPVGCRGHVNYWNDKEVIEILRAHLFVNCQHDHLGKRAA